MLFSNLAFLPGLAFFRHGLAFFSNGVWQPCLQPASAVAGEVADTSELQAHHCMTPEQRTWLLCSVSYRLINCHCKSKPINGN